MTKTSPSPSQRRSAVSVARVGKVAVLAGAILAASVSSADALVLDTGTLVIAPTGVLDLKNNSLIVRSGTPFATVAGYVATGYSTGVSAYWDGPGINSSVAAADAGLLTAVGLINNADPFAGYATFQGVSGLVGTESLGRFTYWGDADLNGLVDAIDYFLIDNGFGSGPQLTGWINGDFDYNGVIDGIDYFLIDNAFAGQGAPIPGLAESGGGALPVPEPGVAMLALFGGCGLLFRRTR